MPSAADGDVASVTITGTSGNEKHTPSTRDTACRSNSAYRPSLDIMLPIVAPTTHALARTSPSSPVTLTTPGILPSQVKLTDEPLGRGSFGSVWRGTFAGSPVAIKVCPLSPPTETPTSRAAIQHFRRETARYHHLRHPCIVQFFCVVHHTPTNSLLLVTELMKGGSLYHALKTLRRIGVSQLPLVAVLRVASHVANGLAYLHASGFSFGDLKSMNVLLSEPPDVQRRSFARTTQAKLCDFGLSRRLDRLLPAETHVPARCGPAGTFAYLAPEAFAGLPVSDANAPKAADVYALAIVLWELATVRSPWSGKQPLQLLRLVAKEGCRPPWPDHHALPPGLIHLVEACWQQKARLRPTAAQVAAGLAAMLDAVVDAPGSPVELSQPAVFRRSSVSSFTDSKQALTRTFGVDLLADLHVHTIVPADSTSAPRHSAGHVRALVSRRGSHTDGAHPDPDDDHHALSAAGSLLGHDDDDDDNEDNGDGGKDIDNNLDDLGTEIDEAVVVIDDDDDDKFNSQTTSIDNKIKNNRIDDATDCSGKRDMLVASRSPPVLDGFIMPEEDISATLRPDVGDERDGGLCGTTHGNGSSGGGREMAAMETLAEDIDNTIRPGDDERHACGSSPANMFKFSKLLRPSYDASLTAAGLVVPSSPRSPQARAAAVAAAIWPSCASSRELSATMSDVTQHTLATTSSVESASASASASVSAGASAPGSASSSAARLRRYCVPHVPDVTAFVDELAQLEQEDAAGVDAMLLFSRSLHE